MFIGRLRVVRASAREQIRNADGLRLRYSYCLSLRWHYPDSGSKGLISAAELSAAPQGFKEHRRGCAALQVRENAQERIAPGYVGQPNGNDVRDA
jgi:hypothetical protein